MKISIIGSGAMGSLFGGKLALAGHEVILYDINKNHINKVNNDGLAIEELSSGKRYITRPKGTTDPVEAANAEVLIIFVKSTVTESAARQFSALTGPDTLVVTLQNGLGNEDILKTYFGADNTAAGVTSQGATFKGPGEIRHAGNGPTHLCMSHGKNERLTPLVDALNNAGFVTEADENIAGLIWSKLVINVGINALTALTGLENGKLLDYDNIKDVMAALVEEAVQVARSKGVTLSYPNPLQTVFEVCEKTAPNRSSMLQDFDRGSATEIDFINNAIVREGEALGIPTPVNSTITSLIKAREMINRRE